MTMSKKPVARRPAKQSENEVEADCIQWLRDLGWRAWRQHSGTFYTKRGTPIPMGEDGICDWRFERPVKVNGPVAANGGRLVSSFVQQFELETKATGEKPTKAQREYMAKRTFNGHVVMWTDSLAMLQPQYRKHFDEVQ